MRPNLFQLGEFVLNSGEESGFKIECDALNDKDWRTLAKMTASRIRFRRVWGIPRGGLKFANALEQYADRSPVSDAPLLIVDDVLTTGDSMQRYRDFLEKSGHTGPIAGVVVFSRSECPDWINPLFQMRDWTL